MAKGWWQSPRTVEGGRRVAAGFTLVELMITLTVLAILVTLAGPSFMDLTRRNRLAAAANEVVAAMQTARMEAVRRNARVVMCPTTDGSACAGSDWSRLVLFVDRNANGLVDSGEAVVRDVEVMKPGSGLKVSASSNVATNNRIRFGADGLARVGAGTATTGALSVCSDKLPAAENTRDVIVAVSRINVETRNGSSACSGRTDP